MPAYWLAVEDALERSICGPKWSDHVRLLGPSIAACGLREQLRLGRAGLPGWYVPKVYKAAGVLLAHHSVHEPVDDLCKKTASLWVWGEMLGIAAASRARGRAVTWEKPFAPCAQREN